MNNYCKKAGLKRKLLMKKEMNILGSKSLGTRGFMEKSLISADIYYGSKKLWILYRITALRLVR